MSRVVRGVAWCLLILSVSLIAGGPRSAVGAPASPTIQGNSQVVAELLAAYKKFGEAKTWRSRMNVPGQQGTMTIEYVAPNRLHFIITGGPQGSGEFFVILGSGTWAKNGPQCIRIPGAGPQLPNPKEQVEHPSDAVVQVTRGGAEAIEGTPTQTYNLVITQRGTSSRQKLYVATATGYPRRVESTSPEGTAIIDYFDFGAPITINDPPC